MAADQYFKCNNQPKTRGRVGGEKGKEIRQGAAWEKRDSIVLVANESGGM
jgi:hypothetical protein